MASRLWFCWLKQHLVLYELSLRVVWSRLQALVPWTVHSIMGVDCFSLPCRIVGWSFESPVALKNGASWSFPIQTEIAFERLQAIELRWTLKSPINPMYLVSKPKIFFEPILASISYIEFGVKLQVFKQFCAERIPQAIEHSVTKLFRPCPIYI
ncbi:uncharacterized protein LOC141848771 [Brevipalpus obovatus]|uniref:uncharacterized protein LOC141848771 n=1 Tax=Brevipalpus obovatus TaxID=246614 RepID=UPI003D9DBBE6